MSYPPTERSTLICFTVLYTSHSVDNCGDKDIREISGSSQGEFIFKFKMVLTTPSVYPLGQHIVELTG